VTQRPDLSDERTPGCVPTGKAEGLPKAMAGSSASSQTGACRVGFDPVDSDGFPVAPGRKLASTQVVAHIHWRADIGAVRALGAVAGQPSMIVIGTDEAATVCSGRTNALSRVG
jgi:hypothetical protein